MFDNIELMKGAAIIVDKCAGGIKEGEKAVIVTDTNKTWLADALARVVFERRGEVILCLMTPRKAHGEDPPVPIVSAMLSADVVFEPTTFSLTRAESSMKAAEKGARVVSLPAYEPSMLISGGLEADFQAQAKLVDKIAEIFSAGDKATLSTLLGTNITMEFGGRKANTGKGFCEGPGTICGPPNIEANISPLEGTANGTIIADVSVPMPGIGLLSEPIRLSVKDGFIKTMSGGREAKLLEKILKDANDPNVYNIAELGVGLNPKAKICGIMLEDEGAMGTVHIGIGDNHTSGGIIKAPLHIDLIISNPTLKIDDKTVIQDGKLTIL
ncbi:MAG: leucyl aminopeptidase [Candidatus Bathyarchaeia archaeon]